MIYYFTGTGNSLHTAQKLAELTGDKISSVAEIVLDGSMPEPNGTTGIVYPIYAWGPPKMVLDFLRRHPIESDYTYSVCTCGEDTGRAMRALEKALGAPLDAAWSITMPNNYIIGMDVDFEAEAKQKLIDAETRIAGIAEAVGNQKRGIYDVNEGSAAGIKSRIVTPLFNAFATSAKSFYSEDSCIGCKRCEAVCPTQNIRVADKPKWGGDCTGCLACINHCPVRAIQRGKGTKSRGRYVNPNCRVEYSFRK